MTLYMGGLYGPNTLVVRDFLDRVREFSNDEWQRIAREFERRSLDRWKEAGIDAHGAALRGNRAHAWDEGRKAAQRAVRNSGVAGNRSCQWATQSAAVALVVEDLLKESAFGILYGPMPALESRPLNDQGRCPDCGGVTYAGACYSSLYRSPGDLR